MRGGDPSYIMATVSFFDALFNLLANLLHLPDFAQSE